MVTDFLQGVFCNLVFAALTMYLLWKFPWSDLSTTLLSMPEGTTLVNPAPQSLKDEANFNPTYWMISAFTLVPRTCLRERDARELEDRKGSWAHCACTTPDSGHHTV